MDEINTSSNTLFKHWKKNQVKNGNKYGEIGKRDSFIRDWSHKYIYTEYCRQMVFALVTHIVDYLATTG